MNRLLMILGLIPVIHANAAARYKARMARAVAAKG